MVISSCLKQWVPECPEEGPGNNVLDTKGKKKEKEGVGDPIKMLLCSQWLPRWC